MYHTQGRDRAIIESSLIHHWVLLFDYRSSEDEHVRLIAVRTGGRVMGRIFFEPKPNIIRRIIDDAYYEVPVILLYLPKPGAYSSVFPGTLGEHPSYFDLNHTKDTEYAPGTKPLGPVARICWCSGPSHSPTPPPWSLPGLLPCVPPSLPRKTTSCQCH